MAIDLTTAKLADIKKKAEAAKDVKWPTIEQFPQHEEYPAAALIAEADPATVLAMVEEIERFRHFVRETLDELHECYNEESCKICKEIDRVIESEATQ